MRKNNSILMILIIVIIASLIVWKVDTPNLISKNKEISTEKVSKKVKKESKKIKKKETSESKSSSSTETSSSVESESSSESSSESTSSASSYQSNVRFPALQAYAGKTYYAVDTDIGFPTTFTITSDTETFIFDGKHELIKSVALGDSGFIALSGETGHSMGTTLSFEFSL